MKVTNIVSIAVVGIVCLMLATAGMAESTKVNNTICPVTGNPVDKKNPVTVEYNGKIYNFCCSMCPATFNSDPEKYSKIAEEQAKTAAQ